MSKTRKIKVISLLLILTVVFSSLFIFSGCELGKDKTAKKDEIEAYFALKDQSNYSDDNWNKMRSIVDNAKRDINKASTKSDVALLACDAKIAMDGVQPQQSDPLQNGAYFISDLSWEYLVRDDAKIIEKDEEWVQIALETGRAEESSLHLRKAYDIAVIDNILFVGHNTYNVYNMSNVNGLYTGSCLNSTVSLWLADDVLNVVVDNKVLQYVFDPTYTVIENGNQKWDKPTGFINDGEKVIDHVSLYWRYQSSYGLIGVAVEVKTARSDSFQLVKIVKPFISMLLVSLYKESFSEGENYIRIYSRGYPYINATRKTVEMVSSSDYATFRVIVSGDDVQVEEII